VSGIASRSARARSASARSASDGGPLFCANPAPAAASPAKAPAASKFVKFDMTISPAVGSAVFSDLDPERRRPGDRCWMAQWSSACDAGVAPAETWPDEIFVWQDATEVQTLARHARRSAATDP
jgi:hypothetical protein